MIRQGVEFSTLGKAKRGQGESGVEFSTLGKAKRGQESLVMSCEVGQGWVRSGEVW